MFAPMIMAIEHSSIAINSDVIKTKLLDMSSEKLSHIFREVLSPIDGISDLIEVNSESDGFISPAPLIAASVLPRDNNTSPPNGSTSDILDMSHNVIEPLLPEMECSAQLQTTNDNDDLQTTDSLMIMTPSILQKIDFIAKPTFLYINKDYDLRSISDSDGVLHSIETQNISQDVVTTESEERPDTPIEQLTKKRKIDPKFYS
ncbi:unnamed protein product [Pieris macdunnoughi]|uniref:Uncharacterized protein n=1 Tax=Pieris macdunnoughi TaxID=345717 RepID=A0A821UI96_9NEOP|nr:unnamed protein product [Pieris macdunnoughi]